MTAAAGRPVTSYLRELMLGPSYHWHKHLIRRSRQWDQRRLSAYLRRMAPDPGLPVRDKAYLLTHLDSASRWCMPGLVKVVRTGGTTGSPFRFYMDRLFRRQKERAYMFDIWSTVGYRPFDLRVSFRGTTSDRLMQYDWRENAYHVSPSVLDDDSASTLARRLSRLDGFFLHVYPSSLLALIKLLGEERFSELPIRGILAGSEAFPLARMNHIREKFKIPIAHWYGHTEYAALAMRCDPCGGFHFYPTYGYVEFLGDETSHKRIVATSYNRIGTRFVRYDTEDLAELDSGQCDCIFPRVGRIVGRKAEFFVDSQGHRHPFTSFLFGIHGDFWDRVQSIQFRQQKAGFLDVLIVADGLHHSAIEETLAHRFPAAVTLNFQYVASIPPTASGKHRYLVSELES